jgi:pimeloyl-ACP methyl ester carboxylesterase
MKLLADDVINVLDHIRVERAHFFGVSMGGAVAQEVAISYPERVGKMALLASWPRPDRYLTSLFELFRDVKRSVDPLTFEREVALWSFTRDYFEEHYDDLEKRQRASLDVPYPTPSTTFARQAEACISHDALDRLPQVTAPTLALVGDRDIFTPPKFSAQISEAVPESKLEIISDAAHAAHWEKSDEVNEHVIAFLSGATVGVSEPVASS